MIAKEWFVKARREKFALRFYSGRNFLTNGKESL